MGSLGGDTVESSVQGHVVAALFFTLDDLGS